LATGATALGCAAILGIEDGIPLAAGSDASLDTGGGPDTATTPDTSTGRCDPTKPFSAPVAVPELSSGAMIDDTAARLTADELRVAFSSSRDGGFDLYEATRATKPGPFSNVVNVPGIDTQAFEESDPALSSDGTVLVYTSDRPKPDGGVGGGFDLWTATRASVSVPFGAPTSVTGANSPQSDSYGYLAGKSLYFASNRIGDFDLYRADFATGVATNVTGLAPVNTTSQEIFPVVSADETVMYFSTARKDGGADYDIWVSVRATSAVPWGTPTAVPEASSQFNDFPSWISGDLCRLYLTQAQASGHFKVFVASR